MQFLIHNIEKAYYNDTKTKQRLVLKDLNLSIDKGESIAIVGPSGSGKSTLLNILGLMDKPDSGKVLYNDNSIFDFTVAEQLEYRNSVLGFVFQQHHLLPQCTVIENILLPTLVSKAAKSESHIRAERLLTELDIWDLRFQKPASLSVGEAQRVAIARSLINEPKLILADEPSGALDEKNAENIFDLLLQFNKNQGISLVMVTHSLKLAKRMNKMYQLEKGRLQLLDLRK